MTTIDTLSAVFRDTIMAHRSVRQTGEMNFNLSSPGHLKLSH